MGDIEVYEIPLDNVESILDIVGRQNSQLTSEQLADRLTAMVEDYGYRCIGAYSDGILVGVAGVWTGCKFWCGRYIEADNVVVDPAFRNRGIGQKLMDWIHEEGKRLGYTVAVLDSYTSFADAHRFYERMGYEKPAYHFTYKLNKDS